MSGFAPLIWCVCRRRQVPPLAAATPPTAGRTGLCCYMRYSSLCMCVVCAGGKCCYYLATAVAWPPMRCCAIIAAALAQAFNVQGVPVHWQMASPSSGVYVHGGHCLAASLCGLQRSSIVRRRLHCRLPCVCPPCYGNAAPLRDHCVWVSLVEGGMGVSRLAVSSVGSCVEGAGV